MRKQRSKFCASLLFIVGLWWQSPSLLAQPDVTAGPVVEIITQSNDFGGFFQTMGFMRNEFLSYGEGSGLR